MVEPWCGGADVSVVYYWLDKQGYAPFWRRGNEKKERIQQRRPQSRVEDNNGNIVEYTQEVLLKPEEVVLGKITLERRQLSRAVAYAARHAYN